VAIPVPSFNGFFFLAWLKPECSNDNPPEL
jgi:excisionase family DNA binding protein